MILSKVGMFCSLLLLPFETSTFFLLPKLYPASVRAGDIHDGGYRPLGGRNIAKQNFLDTKYAAKS